jgi:hypothetical protein
MWVRKKPEPPVREQLVEACGKIRRELQILDAPAYGNAAYQGDFAGSVRARLRAQLAELEAALAEMDPR